MKSKDKILITGTAGFEIYLTKYLLDKNFKLLELMQ